MLLYVAGPYRGDVTENIAKARAVGIEIWKAGHVAIVPHLNTAHFEEDSNLKDDVFLNGDIDILRRCDGIVLVPGWEESEGANSELMYAKYLDMPIWIYPEIPQLQPVEVKYSIQVKAFMETIMRMYRLHLNKNLDYSPMNILGTGEIGLVTRLWDKCARLMNLTGFKIHAELTEFSQPRTPKHESIEDTLLDLSVYGIIGYLLRQGKWGK